MQHHECSLSFYFSSFRRLALFIRTAFSVHLHTHLFLPYQTMQEMWRNFTFISMYSPYYLRNNSNNPCTSPIIPPNNAPKYVIIFNSFFVIDRTKSSNLSVENVDTSCWTISARCRLFSILYVFCSHFKPFVTALGTTFSIIVSRTGSHTCWTDWFKTYSLFPLL